MTNKANHPITTHGDDYQINVNSAAQRARILEYLQKGFTLTTVQARNELDILHPAGRILELRKKGHQIKTHREIVETNLGKKHCVAKYFLSAA